MDLVAAETAYETNADYQTTKSVAKCKLFIDAVVVLLRAPRDWTHAQARMSWDTGVLREELKYARDWLAANEVTSSDPEPGLINFSFTRFRG